jgi:hypothetical protein
MFWGAAAVAQRKSDGKLTKIKYPGFAARQLKKIQNKNTIFCRNWPCT